MDKRLTKVTELREKNELNCMMGLFNILESCQVRASRKVISNGRPVKKHILDYPRKLDQIASFDEECRKIQNEAEMASVSLDAGVKNRRARKKIHKGYKSSLYHLNKEAGSTHPRSSTSEDKSLNELTIAAILRASYNQNDPKESKLSEGIRRSIHLDQVDDFNMRQVQMSAKLFVDQMFIDRNFICKEGSTSESKPFSKSLEVLNLNKDLSMELVLKEPKNVHTFHTTKDAKFFELENKDLASDIAGHPRLSKKGKTNEHSKNIVILKPATSQNRESSENVTCHCSSLQPHQKSGLKVPIDKSTSFSFREKMKMKLKSTFGGNINEPNKFSMDCYAKKEGGNKFNMGPDNDTVRKKLDFSSVKFDVVLEGKRHLSERLKNLNEVRNPTNKVSSKTLERILSSPEHNGRQSTCLSPLTQITEVILSSDCNKKYIEEVIDNMEYNDESRIVEMDSIPKPARYITEEGSIMPSAMDDFQSPPSSINELNMAENNKYQEEHQSPVSVLEPFFTEDFNSPISIMFRTERKPLVKRRLDFEELSISENDSIDERDHISRYVHLVMKASCLNWDQISETRPSSEELIHASLFDEVEYIFPTDSRLDSKLLFDHINEVLLHAYESHFSSPLGLSFVKSRTSSVPLNNLVLDEIMKEAEFYLLPRTEKRTLDQLVSKDLAGSTSWLNVRQDVEEIVINITEDVMEESILDILLEFYI